MLLIQLKQITARCCCHCPERFVHPHGRALVGGERYNPQIARRTSASSEYNLSTFRAYSDNLATIASAVERSFRLTLMFLWFTGLCNNQVC
jgi:hypothetical protein